MRLVGSHHLLRLLLVEDNKGDAILTERALRNSMVGAVEIRRTESLAATLALLSEASFDVALLDRSLPDAEGFDGLRSIQNMAPQLPVIFLTAYRDEKMAFEAIERGAQDYLFKDNLEGHVIRRAIQYAILRKQFEEVLIQRANFDMLTGLANRVLFENMLDVALAKMRRHGGYVAVLFLDLNRFKHVNDTLGHAAGDRLLREVGQRLKRGLRSYDTVARFGGDEFAVLLEEMSGEAHAELVAQKIIALLEAPFDMEGHSCFIGVSIGIAHCNSEHGVVERDAFIGQADAAMYEAKLDEESSCYRSYAVGRSELAKIVKKA